MLLLIIAFIVIVFGVFCFFKDDGDWSDWEVGAWISVVLGGILTITFIAVLYFNPISIKKVLYQRDAFIQTIEDSRMGEMSDFERAAITKEIADWNEWLVGVQFNNKRWEGRIFIPDLIDDVKPIK